MKKRIQYEKKIKAISWVIGYGIFRILPDTLENKKGIKNVKTESVFDGVEQIRLLTLAILSGNVDCFNIVLNYVDPKHINSNCLSKSGQDQTMFNKHRKFTPLTMACYKGFFVAIRKLVEKGSEVNSRTKMVACH